MQSEFASLPHAKKRGRVTTTLKWSPTDLNQAALPPLVLSAAPWTSTYAASRRVRRCALISDTVIRRRGNATARSAAASRRALSFTFGGAEARLVPYRHAPVDDSKMRRSPPRDDSKMRKHSCPRPRDGGSIAVASAGSRRRGTSARPARAGRAGDLGPRFLATPYP